MGAVDARPSGTFSIKEVEEVLGRYPQLRLVQPNVLAGAFAFDATYDDNLIRDCFSVRIVAPTLYPVELPKLIEIGGRTDAIATKHDVRDFRTLHRNTDGTACLCVKQMERRKVPPGSNLLVFVENLVVPYLYGLSSYEVQGCWPWPEYSHGALGLLEFYADNDKPQTRSEVEEIFSLIRRENNWKEYSKQVRNPHGARHCLCGSGKEFARCHPRAWIGLTRLNQEVKRLGIRRRL